MRSRAQFVIVSSLTFLFCQVIRGSSGCSFNLKFHSCVSRLSTLSYHLLYSNFPSISPPPPSNPLPHPHNRSTHVRFSLLSLSPQPSVSALEDAGCNYCK